MPESSITCGALCQRGERKRKKMGISWQNSRQLSGSSNNVGSTKITSPGLVPLLCMFSRFFLFCLYFPVSLCINLLTVVVKGIHVHSLNGPS